MTKEQALNVLVQTALIAQSKGALALNDAVLVKQAIELLQPPQELSKPEATKEVDTNENKDSTKK